MCVLLCIHHRTILLLIELGHDLRRVPACGTMIFENFRSVSFRDSFCSVTGVVPSALATSQDIARGEGQAEISSDAMNSSTFALSSDFSCPRWMLVMDSHPSVHRVPLSYDCLDLYMVAL